MTSRWRTSALLLCALVLSACAAPTQQYIASEPGGMYFSLPVEWTAVPAPLLEKAQTGWTDDAGQVVTSTITWQGAWSPSDITATDVFAGAAAAEPIVYAMRRDLIDVEQGELGTDLTTALQDLVIPATELLTRGADLTQSPLTRNGFRGIEQLATYEFAGTRQTVQVTSMLSPDTTALYQLVIRCSEQCYADNTDVINRVLDALTFEEVAGNG